MSNSKLPRQLPVRQHKDRIVDKIQLNRVSLIVAETGSGKSSQVPQMLLEEGIAPVLCTQPRRLAVVAISKVVAQERGCQLGEEIGYHIGQKKVVTARSKVIFETTGVLLEELRSDGAKVLSRYKVVIFDEVHERSIESDLALTCIKQFMLRNGSTRLVLMSATFDCVRYRDYFKDLDRGERVEIIPISNSSTTWQSIPFQNKVYYLEDVMDILGKKKAALTDSYSTLGPCEKANDIGEKDQRMITDLVIYLHKNDEDLNKSMLIFLPTYKALEQQWSLLKDTRLDLKIYVLHSSIDMDHSMQAMEVSHSIRKVILATNVAESSVTIPRISYVIDSCRSLEIYWDDQRKKCIPRLVWVSQSQADQRKGRTGRVCHGQVFRMVSKDVYYTFAEFETPSMQLLSLREQVLMLSCADSKAINDPKVLFSKAMDPPNPLTVKNALEMLQSIDALKASQQRGKYFPTTYGKLLASLPLSLESSILVIKGGQLGLLRETVVVASLMDASPFPIVHPFGHESEYQMYLERYYQRQAFLYGETVNFSHVSILLANLHAFEFWQCALKDKQRLDRLVKYGAHIKNRKSEEFIFVGAGEQYWCAQHHISSSALHGVAEMCAIVIEKMHLFRPNFLSKLQGPPSYYCSYEFQHVCDYFANPENLMGKIILQEDQLQVESGICFQDHFVTPGQFHRIEDLDTLRTLIGQVQKEFLHGGSHTEEEAEPSFDVTSLCRFFQRGVCMKGSACHFSHDLAAKRSLCKYFMSDLGCRYGELCEFRHTGISQFSSISTCPIDFEEESPSAETFLDILPSYGERAPSLGTSDEENVLVYGEDDFIFTENLSKNYKPSKIIATSVNARENACNMGKATLRDRVNHLSASGVKIIWAVDSSLCLGDASAIPWNNIACVLWTIRSGDNDEAIAKSLPQFFSSLSVILLSQGLADISLVLTMQNNQYAKWQVERVARDSFFFLVESMPFDMVTFGLYNHTNNKGSSSGEPKPVTYVFELLPPSTSLHGEYCWHLQQALGA